MIAFRVVPHGPECMRDTRELVLARPTRWRCSPDLESERGGHSAAQPDLLPHPVRIVAVRAACRGIERVNRFVRNKLLDAVDLPTNGKHRADGQHIVLRLIAVAVRPEERSVGNECVSKGRSVWAPFLQKKK